MKSLYQQVKERLEREYDIVKWINGQKALVHYWDDDNGDYYLEEDIEDLMDNVFDEDEDDGLTSYCIKHYC